ncbi:MAG: TlpA family protein disulfide reductase [Clostridia bacterium]|nr:TlpA family protein disulfide reductase [Clostridia bacterium]
MKNILKWILILAVLAGVIAGAAVLYNKLSEDYGADLLIENTESHSEAEKEDANKAPDFTVVDYNGNEVRLSDFRGKPVVLNFWATWCYYCDVEMPDFNEAYKEYPDVQFMMVNATDGVRETVESAKNYIENEGYDFDVFFDTQYDAVNSYYVRSFPTTFFIDKEGNLVVYQSGMLDMDSLKKGISMING